MPERRESYFKIINKIYPTIYITYLHSRDIIIEQSYNKTKNEITLSIDELPELVNELLDIYEIHKENQSFKIRA